MSMRFTGAAMSWEVRAEVLEVRLHREPCNEIGTVALGELERLGAHLHNPALPARACVIYSDRRRGFCAGADLGELYDGLMDRARSSRTRGALRALVGPDLGDRALRRLGPPLLRRELRRFIDRVHAAFDAIDTSPVAVIAALHGVVFGGGFELALLADVRVADKSTRFAFPELRLGIVPGFGGLPRLARDVGNATVRDLLLTGRSLGARRAYELGLVSQVVAKGRALDVARGVARQTTKFNPDVLRRAKAFAKPVPRAALAAERDLFCDLVTDPGVVRALDAFVHNDTARPYLP